MKRLRAYTEAEHNKPPSPVPHPRFGSVPSTLPQFGYEDQHHSNGFERQEFLPSGWGQVAIPGSASQITIKGHGDDEVVYDVPRKYIPDDVDIRSNPSYGDVFFQHSGTASQESETPCSEGLSIQQLVQKHSNSLPARTKVVQGYYGQNVELITDELYDIHFIKHQKVVNIKDAQGTIYTVPLASSLQFGLLFNHGTQQEDNTEGITFHKASDIMAQRVLPGVVCATKAFPGADEMSSVQENEVLKVLCVEVQGKECLKVFSFRTQSEKVLRADCAGEFSTKPSLIRLHLSDIITCIPCRAVIFIDETATPPTVAKKFSTSLLSGPIIITGSKIETSLVASLSKNKKPVKPSQKDSGKVTLLDIPLADHLSEVEFSIMELASTQESELLREDTRNIMREFDPSKLKHLREAKSARIARLQSLLYTEVQKGQRMVGIELECSIEPETPPPKLQVKFDPSKLTLKQNDKVQQATPKLTKVTELTYETLPGEPEHNGVRIHDPATQPDTAALTKHKPAPVDSKEPGKQSSISKPPPTPPRKYFPSLPSAGKELECSTVEDESTPPASQTKLNSSKLTLKRNDEVPKAKLKLTEVRYETLPGEPEYNEVHAHDPATQPDTAAVLTKPKPAPVDSKETVKQSTISKPPPTPPRKYFLSSPLQYESVGDNNPPGKPNAPPAPAKPSGPPAKPNVLPKGNGYSKSSLKPVPAARKKPEVNVKPSESENESNVRLNLHTTTEPIEVRLNVLESQSKKHDQALQCLNDMQSHLEHVAMKLLSLETQVETLTLSSAASAPFEDSSSTKSTRQQNKQHLRSLDNTQVGYTLKWLCK